MSTEIQQVSLENVTMDEAGNMIVAKADGSGTIAVTPEQLEEGMVSFGKDISSEEMLDTLGGVLNKPIQEAVSEFAKNPENEALLKDCTSLEYMYNTTSNVRYPVKKDGVVTYEVSAIQQVEAISYDCSEIIDDAKAKKLIRRLANVIEAKVLMSTNVGILGFMIERIAPSVVSISIKRTESSRYTFQIRI